MDFFFLCWSGLGQVEDRGINSCNTLSWASLPPPNHQVFHTQGLAHPKRIVPTTAPKMEMEAMRQQSLRRKTLNGVEVMFKVCRDYRHFQRAAGDPGGAGG
jgi:hypothetical protein